MKNEVLEEKLLVCKYIIEAVLNDLNPKKEKEYEVHMTRLPIETIKGSAKTKKKAVKAKQFKK